MLLARDQQRTGHAWRQWTIDLKEVKDRVGASHWHLNALDLATTLSMFKMDRE